MKTLFERVFNGSDQMFAKAEEEVNKIAAEVVETLDIRPKGFSPFSRYSFRHSLFLKLHSSFRYCFVASAMLLYQSFRIPELRCRV